MWSVFGGVFPKNAQALHSYIQSHAPVQYNKAVFCIHPIIVSFYSWKVTAVLPLCSGFYYLYHSESLDVCCTFLHTWTLFLTICVFFFFPCLHFKTFPNIRMWSAEYQEKDVIVCADNITRLVPIATNIFGPVIIYLCIYLVILSRSVFIFIIKVTAWPRGIQLYSLQLFCVFVN